MENRSMRKDSLERVKKRPSSSKGYLGLLYLLIMIVCANQFLYLGEWVHVPGVFNVRDVGNLMIILGIVFLMLSRGVDPALRNRMSILIILYIFLVAIHVALATLYYEQPLRQGILGARHHLYYLSFFLFLILLNSQEKVRRFLNLLTVLALVIFALAIINYFGPTLFDHRWAEGHGVRGGVVRAFIPAMSIVSVAAVWEFSKMSERGRFGTSSLAGFTLFAAHVFRQTRMRTVGLILVILWMLAARKRYLALITVLFIGIAGTMTFQIMTEKDVLTSQITSAIQDVREGEGTWKGRMAQLETAIAAFEEYPVLGSGSLVLRPGESAVRRGSHRKLYELQYKADLGYASWMKSFGSVGLIWLFLFMYFWWTAARRIQKSGDGEMVVEGSFLQGLLIFFAGTFLTLNHFMYPGAIVFVCMGAAIGMRLSLLKNETENPPQESALEAGRKAGNSRGGQTKRLGSPG